MISRCLNSSRRSPEKRTSRKPHGR
jgi:hypothetical protein